MQTVRNTSKIVKNNPIFRITNTINLHSIFNFVFFESNHDLNKSIIVAGANRSGTTWLADTLGNHLNYRMIFEPFKLNRRLYIPSYYKSEKHFNSFKNILSGRVWGLWVNQNNRVLKPKGRIIKTIFANLYLKWIKNNFPEIPIIFIIRHPCSVVLSRFKKNWVFQPETITKQKLLINDHLEPYMDIIFKAKTTIQKIACGWCIDHLIPLKSMKSEDWVVVAYEDLVVDPESEITKLFNYLSIDKRCDINIVKSTISMTATKKSAISKKTNPLLHWKEQLSLKNINEIMNIVEAFSLDYLYDDEIMPKKRF